MPKKDALLILLCTLIIGSPLYWFQSTRLANFGVDWNIAFYPAARLLLQGQNPYQVQQFHNPVWALLPLLPFALMGRELGRLALFYFNLFSVIYIAWRLHAKPVALIFFIFSPLLYYYLFLGNIDTLALWGLFMPPMIGLFFLTIKPQVTIAVIIYWGYITWRAGKAKGVLIAYAPVAAALAASFLVFGNWLADPHDHLLNGAYWNVSLFPWSIPVGLALAVAAIRYKKVITALSASPFLSPYLTVGSWQFALCGLLDNNLLMVGAVGFLWLLYIASQFVFR